MAEKIDNLMLEHLKNIQGELAATRERDREMLSRLSSIETSIARIGRDKAHAFTEQIEDRHVVDSLKARVERIERRLEISE